MHIDRYTNYTRKLLFNIIYLINRQVSVLIKPSSDLTLYICFKKNIHVIVTIAIPLEKTCSESPYKLLTI
jgi:hypothetical protein